VRADRADVLVVPGRGLQLLRELPFERWVIVGRQLSEMHSSSAWCLGDWLVYGQAAYARRYREAIEQTRLDYQTLRNYAWVAKQFALSRRRDSLSFGHHAELAALPEAEQDFWLRKADELGWPVKRLRREVRSSLHGRPADDAGQAGSDSAARQLDPPGPAGSPAVRLQVHLTPEQLQACRAAAGRAGLTVQAWAVLALDQAARNTAQTVLT
jgi:hypothetical protein